MPIEAVLFDVGNTLCHLDYAWLAQALAEASGTPAAACAVACADASVRRAGIPTAAGDPAAWAALPPQRRLFRRYMGAVARQLGCDAEVGVVLGDRAWEEHSSSRTGLWRVVDPDATQVLATLAARGIACAAVSNADGRVRAQLELLGLGRWLHPIVDSAEVGVAKPDPRIFDTALRTLGVAPQKALYVGDLLDVDVRGAERAGLGALLYDRCGVYEGIVPAAQRIRRLGELTARLDAGTAPLS